MMFARYMGGGTMLLCVLAGCAESREQAVRVTGGDPQRGRVELKRHACGVCHVIPGVRGARGQVGPTLESYSRRVYVAGKFSKDPEVLMHWIKDAPLLAPDSAMPAIDVTEQQARDMAAYLYTLK
jgi:cytochrome c2